MKHEYSKFERSALRATESSDAARLSASPSTETISHETPDSSGCYGSWLPSSGGEDVYMCVWSLGMVVVDTKVSVTDFRVLSCSRDSWRVQSERKKKNGWQWRVR